MTKKIIMTLMFLFIGINPSVASENGEIEKSSNRVVPLYINEKFLACSGYLYEPRIVFTVAHCFNNNHKPTHIGLPGQIAGPTAEKISFQQVIFSPAYNISRAYENDFAIIILSRPVAVPYKAGILTEEIANKINSLRLKTKVSGYGDHDLTQTTNDTVREPRYIYATLQSITNEVYLINDQKNGTNTSPGTVCSGDSGGSNTIFYDDQEIYLGATSHGYNQPNCGRYGNSGQPSLLFDPVYEYNDLIAQAKEIVGPEPIVIQQPIQKPTLKITIVCTKGKTTKKITSVKPVSTFGVGTPKCPSGYKKQ